MRAIPKKAVNKVLNHFIIVCIIICGVFGGCAGVSSATVAPDPNRDETQLNAVEVALTESSSETASNMGIYLSNANRMIFETPEDTDASETTVLGWYPWSVSLTRDDLSLIGGKKHRISFTASSAVHRFGTLRLQSKSAPYTTYLDVSIELTPQAQAFSYDFEMTDGEDALGLMLLSLGPGVGDGENTLNNEHKIILDELVLSVFEREEKPWQMANSEIPKIHVDQLGYIISEKKYAVILSEDIYFEVWDAKEDKSVYHGMASDEKKSFASNEMVRIADFSDFITEGTYYIKNSEGRSYDFVIEGEPYTELTAAVFNMFDYQKCGTEVDADKWSHEACHTQEALIYGTNTMLDVSGGWHDAGDYGRYVVPAAKAAADILMAYEMGFTTDERILEAVKYELDWLLKMQDKNTGGVYHKVTPENFCGFIMPEDEKDMLVLSPVSSTATADFAAIMAMAARIYEGEFAIVALDASKKAWAWLEANPVYAGFKNPEGIKTGEYGDDSDKDERYWAACELFRTTLDDAYHIYIKNSVAYQGFGWADMGYYGSVSYLNIAGGKTDYETYARIESSVLDAARSILDAYNEDPYMISLGRDYPWGSNMNVANNAMLMIHGYNISKNEEYIQAIRDHLHYLLGRNPLSQSYVTGYGTKTPANPHHRPSVVVKKAVPGMLVGGPSQGLEDPFAAYMLKGAPEAKSYIDSDQSYSTNEVTIYWNSPLYFMLTYLQYVMK